MLMCEGISREGVGGKLRRVRPQTECTCASCEVVFLKDTDQLRDGRKNYCSKECCSIGHRKPVVQKQCPKCGVGHELSGTFCSHACANSRGPRTEEFKEKVRRALSKGRKTEFICDGCGDIGVKHPKHLKKNGKNFCSRACYITFRPVPSLAKSLPICLECNNPVKDIKRSYCSIKCKTLHTRRDKIAKWLRYEMRHTYNERIPEYIRDYMLEDVNSKCEGCGWSKVNPVTGRVPLQVNHKDGNPCNHDRENLELLCGACHSITTTYCSLNWGKGRKSRKTILRKDIEEFERIRKVWDSNPRDP